MSRKYQKGIIPLALLGVAFITLSLAGVTVVASNPDLSLSINSWAKRNDKTWRDYGPKVRQAYKAAQNEAYQAQKEDVSQVDTSNLNQVQKEQLAELQAKIARQSLLSDSEIETLNKLTNVEPRLPDKSEAAGGEQEDVGSQPSVPVKPAGSGIQEDATLNQFIGSEPGTNPFTGKLELPVIETLPQQPTTLTTTPDDVRPLNPESAPIVNQPVSRDVPQTILDIQDPVAQGKALESWSNAQRRELSNDVITTVTTNYEDVPITTGRVKATERTIVRDRATGNIISDSQENGTSRVYNVVETEDKKPGAFESKTTYTETESKIDWNGGRRVDTVVKYDESGKFVDANHEIYLIKYDGTTTRELGLGSLWANLIVNIFPPVDKLDPVEPVDLSDSPAITGGNPKQPGGNEEFVDKPTTNFPQKDELEQTKTAELRVGDTWVAEGISGDYHKYVKDAVGSHIVETYKAGDVNVETVVGRVNTTTIVTNPTTGEIITSSSEPNKPTVWGQIVNFFTPKSSAPVNPVDVGDSQITGGNPKQPGGNEEFVDKPTTNFPQKDDTGPVIYPPNKSIVVPGNTKAEGDLVLTTDKDGNVIKREYKKYNTDGSPDGFGSFLATTWNNIVNPLPKVVEQSKNAQQAVIDARQAGLENVTRSAAEQRAADLAAQKAKEATLEKAAQEEFARAEIFRQEHPEEKFEALSKGPVEFTTTTGKGGSGTGTVSFETKYSYDPHGSAGDTVRQEYLGWRDDKYTVIDDNTGQVIDTYIKKYQVRNDGVAVFDPIQSWVINAWNDLLGIK